MVHRRKFILGGAATAFGLISPSAFAQIRCPVKPDEYLPAKNNDFERWVTGFQKRARQAGIRQETLEIGFRGVGYVPDVIKRDRTQFQKRRTLEDYLAIATSDERIRIGREAVKRHYKLLQALQNKYGVDANIIAAIWGVESKFGQRRGAVPVVASTATLAFDGRRGAFYESQLVAALRILQKGDVVAKNLTGSWAGAMGHTQFIPTSYISFAVDANGDGRRDVWSDDPTDALASTAAYLARNGWRRGLKWGGEIGMFQGSGKTIQPQAGGPKFMVTRNYSTLLRYNNSASYAVSVGHLADRLSGGPKIQGRFPRDAYGFTKSDRIVLQKSLSRKGYKLGTIDGVIGPKTNCAIASFQKRGGFKVTGRPSFDLLRTIGK